MNKISVVMSVYNEEKSIKSTINSVLNQSYKNFEFIIVDDSSTDDTNKIISGYNDERIIIIRNTNNYGLTKSLNIGINKSIGSFIARIDAGDVCERERFQKQIDIFVKNPKIGIVGTWGQFVNKRNKKLFKYKPPIYDFQIKKNISKMGVILHPSAMIRRDLFNNYGLYNESFRTGQESELWLRLSPNTKMYNIPEILITCKYDSNSISYQKTNEQIKNNLNIITNSEISFGFRMLYSILSNIYLFIPMKWKYYIKILKYRIKYGR